MPLKPKQPKGKSSPEIYNPRCKTPKTQKSFALCDLVLKKCKLCSGVSASSIRLLRIPNSFPLNRSASSSLLSLHQPKPLSVQARPLSVTSSTPSNWPRPKHSLYLIVSLPHGSLPRKSPSRCTVFSGSSGSQRPRSGLLSVARPRFCSSTSTRFCDQSLSTFSSWVLLVRIWVSFSPTTPRF